MTAAKPFLTLDNKLGESPVWHAARRKLYWLDLYAPAVFECDLDGSNYRTRPLPVEAPIGSMVATTDPDHVMIALRSGLHMLHIDTLQLTLYCDPEQGRSAVIPNDMKVDHFGRIWLATSHDKERDPRGALWCIVDRTTWALADVGFPVSNGPAFSPDGRTLYFNDSVNRITFAYDVSLASMRAENRRILATYNQDEGMPDGVTVDADGNLWIAMWGSGTVQKLSPDGKKLLQVDVAADQPTSVAFAGAALDHLIITSARDGLSATKREKRPLSGSVFSFAPGVHGIAEPLFNLTND